VRLDFANVNIYFHTLSLNFVIIKFQHLEDNPQMSTLKLLSLVNQLGSLHLYR